MLNFLGIGAQKAGTTWLYEMLAKHPQIAFPPMKEVHFWNAQQHLGLQWYEQLFAGDASKIHGEITPAYGFLPLETIRQIHTLYPDIRLIYLIRNPIYRAWSSALMALGRAEMQIHEASDQWFIDHFNSQGSLKRGDYESCLRNWRQIYPSEQLLILNFDQIKQNPRALLTQCSQHLGIDESFYKNLPDEIIYQKVFEGAGHPLRESLRPVLQNLYTDKILSLADYLQQDLSAWS
ncbi:MAG: sulfotransferase [Thiotrichaceae bacterium]|nr:sulfotransferase [Thiotrichaceae bacterium]